MFGYVRGDDNDSKKSVRLRNIVLNNINVYFYKDVYLVTSNSTDLRVGTLAAVVGQNSIIENIIVKNSTISDGGHDVKLNTLFCGGVIGEMQKHFGDNNINDNDKPITVRNIYADVDIDLGKVTRNGINNSGKLFNNNVGGILGRGRTLTKECMPENVCYTGRINAPWAFASSLWGTFRSADNTDTNNKRFSYAATAFSGEWGKENGDTRSYLKRDEANNANRYFYDYTLTVDGENKAITDTYPANVHETTGIRTISPVMADSVGSFNSVDVKDGHLKQVQGVNHAKYIDIREPEKRAELLAMYSDYVKDRPDLRPWAFIGDSIRFKISVAIERKGFDKLGATVGGVSDATGMTVEWTLTLTDGTVLTPVTTTVDKHDTEFTITDTHPDHVKSVQAVLRHEDNELDTTTLDFEDPMLSLSRSGISSFIAGIEESKYPEARYRFLWQGDYDDGAGFVNLSHESEPALSDEYEFGDEAQPHIIKVILCDGEMNPIHPKDDPEGFISGTITLSKAELDANLILSARMVKVGANYRPVAYIRTQDGALAAGGHSSVGEFVSHPKVSFRWETTNDPTDPANWRHDYPSGTTLNSWGAINSYDTYHRVTWYLDNDSISTVYVSFRRLVFVYNKEHTTEGQKNKGVCSGFDNTAYPDGDDANTGLDPYHAVRTMKRAYNLLESDNSVADNVIVLMGYNNDNNFWRKLQPEDEPIMSKCATIQGRYGDKDFKGTLNLRSESNDVAAIRGATLFRHLTLDGRKFDYEGKDAIAQMVFLYCNLHDITFDMDVRMTGYDTYGANDSGLGNYQSTKFSLIGGYHNYNVAYNSHADALKYPSTNAEEGVTTITIKSGSFGRIMAAARNDGGVYGNTLNVFGHPLHPHRSKVIVAIDHKAEGDDKLLEYSDHKYPYDIGLLVGGQTDGSVFTETEITMTRGSVGRFIAGNISFGRKAALDKKRASSDGFYGSTILNLKGGTVKELVGGILGRNNFNDKDNNCEIYFYGRTILNIGEYGGNDDAVTIEENIYGAGAGGVMGLGYDASEWHHTDDQYIPHVNMADGGVKVLWGDYGTVKANGAIKMPLRDGTLLDLGDSYCQVNVMSGTIGGDVFGGGLGYSSQINYQRASPHAGSLYGRSSVNISGGLIKGNVYGGAAGDATFQNNKIRDKYEAKDFSRVACIYGTSSVDISGGVILGDVYAGSKGVVGYPQMAAIYGTTQLHVTGGTIYGDIYGGSSLANMDKLELSDNEVLTHAVTSIDGKNYLQNSGNTYVTVTGGVIGDNIFGGSRGEVADVKKGLVDTKSNINGDTHVTITGGEFLSYPYKQRDLTEEEIAGLPNAVEHAELYRSFNIYGGGNLNCDINGTAYLNITSSLLVNEKSFLPRDKNPNGLTRHSKSESFQAAYMDLTFRRFGVYGGGYGANTNVLNTDVRVNVQHTDMDVAPHGITLESPLSRQSFFDIAGGGYSGDVGYWTYTDPVDGVVKPSKSADLTGMDPHDVVNLYQTYKGGRCKVTIDGNTFARKVIGGGFYGSCYSTDTRVIGGSLRQVYGGSLLGYVFRKANLQLGNRTEDFIEHSGGSFRFNEDPTANEGWEGSMSSVPGSVVSRAEAEARHRNSTIYVTENIYGGNDVKGIIGTRFWTDPDGRYALDYTDGGPLYCSDVADNENNGVIFNIYGGTYMGNVYGAGNGHYRGYFVPEAVRYSDGPERMYREVKSVVDPTKKARAYRSRPMVGNVNINIRGNSANDRVHMIGNFFGGGSECTIGEFNTILPLEDPRRLTHGGQLRVNFGGHVTVDGNVYMGNEGQNITRQGTVPSDVTLKGFNPTYTAELDKLGDLGYSHWYYDTGAGCYKPGFPTPGEVDGNYGMTGEHMFYSYIQNVMMEGRAELTFYRDIYQRNADGSPQTDDDGIKVRKHWVPGETALSDVDSEELYRYDATDMKMNSFFLGGLSGSMSHNNVMLYCFEHHSIFDPESGQTHTVDSDVESRGSIYRVALPEGLTLRDKAVMGSENARTEYYQYADADCHTIKKSEVAEDGTETELEPTYVFDGGVVPQNLMGFDLMVYNAVTNYSRQLSGQRINIVRDLPEDFYDDTNSEYADMRGKSNYTFPDDYFDSAYAGKTIYRRPYTNENINAMVRESRRYDLASWDEAGAVGAVGQRLTREFIVNDILNTVTKLTARCSFDLMESKPDDSPDAPAPGSPELLYGGNIYGGCYHSGLVVGDVVMNIGSDLLGTAECFKDNGAANFGDWSSMKYNIGRVFGGGFGQQTTVEGDTYVNLLRNFRGMNVFGGGMEGNVNGMSHINYIGTEKGSYIFGNLYGGALMGDVGNGTRSAVIRLYSGNVNNVYGGSCMGKMKGRTFIEVTNAPTVSLDYLDLNRLLKQQEIESWGESRLIAGSIYGGNDIAGTITNDGKEVASIDDPDNHEKVEAEFTTYTSGIWLHEDQDKKHIDKPRYPGGKNGYIGFPLVGELFGASNGSYGSHSEEDGIYADGVVEIADGEANGVRRVELAGMDVPHLDKTYLRIEGGSVVNAYGGGDRCNVTEEARINVNYHTDCFDARAGFDTREEMERVWNVLHFHSNDQQSEVSKVVDDKPVFTSQIFRLFGGNNNHDMAIQPRWELKQGFVGSLYSGGNFGRMTYCERIPGTNLIKGLELNIDNPLMRVDHVYGGGRIGDIAPDLKSLVAEDEDPHKIFDLEKFYGATLNISEGVIDHVFGGNDVSGVVYYGTNVNITGAISGDVYSAGNGNYLYYYDTDTEKYEGVAKPKIQEAYTSKTIGSVNEGSRYFILPPKADYKVADKDKASAATIMAINSYRPHVEKARLSIEGSENHQVWVRGSVYCGGNSSTVMSPDSIEAGVEFNIGDYVYLNGVFMGSNGQELALGSTIDAIQSINDISMLDKNTLTATDIPETDAEVLNGRYPTALDLYMRAVEMHSIPKDFDFKPDLMEAYIGDFNVGGNRGSLVLPKGVELNFPERLVIYNSIVGGCRNANVNYGGERGVNHRGGVFRELDKFPAADSLINISIKSIFAPVKMDFNFEDKVNPKIQLVTQRDEQGMYPDGVCNIYGGCLDSGYMDGDINLNVYSDLLHYFTETTDGDDNEELINTRIDKLGIIKGMALSTPRRSFSVIGAGCGADTEVRGNVSVNMLPGVDSEGKITHPSVATIFGGAKEGLLVGRTEVTIRDGKILANVYGASEASRMYGSSSVIVGYPTVYRAKETGVFALKRTDYHSATARNNYKRANGTMAMAKSIALVKGEIVPKNVWDIVVGRVKDEVVNGDELIGGVKYEAGRDVPKAYYDAIDDSNPKTNYFDEVTAKPEDIEGVTWDDITIWVGDQGDTYYGHGNIYGGGYLPSTSKETLAGKITLLRYNSGFNPDSTLIKNNIYGGNTAVVIWDNPANADLNIKSGLRDHISVGTSMYRQVIPNGSTVKNCYVINATGEYEYQTSGEVEDGVTYYEKVADGGVYGGGRTVFAEGFRSVDLAYYGYADHTPQNPKLLNTIQRASMASVTDCCLELVGAEDFTTESTGIDAELYSINRVDELRMVSSLDPDNNLESYDQEDQKSHLLKYSKKRCRNFISLVHPVRDMASFYSNWTAAKKYHDAFGKKPKESLSKRGREYMFTDESGAKINRTDYIIEKYGNQDTLTYTLFKHDKIEDYYALKAQNKDITAEDLKAFSERNVGTSANMLGMHSNFSLRVQGHSVKPGQTAESVYYGPVYGVAEMKLLSGAPGEGGGYVYALNRHYDPETDGADRWSKTTSWMGEWGQDFYMVSGNFVYPGAPFGKDKEAVGYMVDDCMPDGAGYDSHIQAGLDAGKKKEDIDVNEANEQHYWFVRGSTYRYAVTITGITSDEPQNFYINNTDSHIQLDNVRPGARIRVKNVLWYKHGEEGTEQKVCELQDTTKRYSLFLTVDHNTRHTDANPVPGAYKTEIPREDYSGGDYQSTYDNYTEGDATVANVAALGLRLYDNQKNRFADEDISVGREYYEKFLSMPHNLQVTLEAQNKMSNGSYEDITFTYIIDIDIRYLLGPMIQGTVNIENSALPGEYIYVNAEDLAVDMDEKVMAITSQGWRIYPTDANGRIKDADGNELYLDVVKGSKDYAGDKLDDYIVERNEQALHIPAFYYMNGWEVTYRVAMTGYSTEIKMPENERLRVHNYHRMLPVLKSSREGDPVLDQHLIEGARVYIEDEDDLAYFLKYMGERQAESTMKLPDESVLNPQYAEGVNFYLCDNLTLPVAEAGTDNTIFKGNFHGNGYTLTIPSSMPVNFSNAGAFYNTGFFSQKNIEDTRVFADVKNGMLANCFYFNPYGKGSLLGGHADDARSVANCYQNTPVRSEGADYNELLQLPDDSFHNGMVAYNLNGYYLFKRHILLHGITDAGKFNTDNNSYALAEKDAQLLKDYATAEAYKPYSVEYIENYYNNGDYRFADYDPLGVGTATALRTEARPNYFDESNKHGTGMSVTNHNTALPQDESRWNKDHQLYHPIFENDYLFFGEDLTVNYQNHDTEYPTHFTPANRVFRVSGFYGSAVDKGYFFNRDAYVDSPLITAIDFMGYRDRDLYDAGGYLKADYRKDIDKNGWVNRTGLYQIYCPPAIDLPWKMVDGAAYHDYSSFAVNSDVVTNNLLLYTRNNSVASGYAAEFHYQEGLTADNYTQHAQSEIRAHHVIVPDNGEPEIYKGYFHLKDNHDFNAPIAFRADNCAWYDRQPENYADVYTITDGNITECFKSGWDAICLPFTVGTTFAATSNPNIFSKHMGEITHFFGTDSKCHEYWLRRFKGVDAADPSRLLFERPTAENMVADEDKVIDYEYSNTALSDLYREEGYTMEFDDLYHFDDDLESGDTKRSRTIYGYRMLSEGVPYVMAYPGESYYEFDLSGNFYAHMMDDKAQSVEKHTAVPQKILYMARKVDGVCTVPVTDDISKVEYARAGGFTMAGGFMHITPEEAQDRDYYLINEDGTHFVKNDYDAVKPFHAYLYRSSQGSGEVGELMIAGDRYRTGEDEVIPSPQEPESPEDELGPQFKVWSQDGVLYILAPCDMQLYIYNTMGQAVRYVKAYKGENRYSGLVRGLYIVARKKVVI